MTQEELDARAKKEKAGRSRRPKKAEEKSGPEGKSRSAKTTPAKKQREQSSQSKGGKATPGGGSGSAPAVEAEAAAKLLRPIQDAKIVYLKLSELHPFHTFRQHPFAVTSRNLV